MHDRNMVSVFYYRVLIGSRIPLLIDTITDEWPWKLIIPTFLF